MYVCIFVQHHRQCHPRTRIASIASIIVIITSIINNIIIIGHQSISRSTTSHLFNPSTASLMKCIVLQRCHSPAAYYLTHAIHLYTHSCNFVYISDYICAPIHIDTCTSKYTTYIHNNIPTTFAAPVYLPADLIILNSLNAPLH